MGELAFTAHHAGTQCIGDTEIAGEIRHHHGLFQPTNIILVQPPGHHDSFVHPPAHIDIDHDGDVFTQGIPQGDVDGRSGKDADAHAADQ